nr:lasso peptide biosynthesis B2 protein [Candidatus Omnitrophota bacterium]
MKDIFLFARVSYLFFILPVIIHIKPLPEILKSWTPCMSPKLREWDILKITKYLDLFFKLRALFFSRRGTCLKRSLILYKFLREKGIEVRINIGVKGDNKKIYGHAWLTLDDKPYLAQPQINEDFKVCFIFPPHD